MRRRFFVDRFYSGSASVRGESAEHLGRVLRAEPGQVYELSDGRAVWLARIEHVDLPKRGDARIDFTLVEPIPVRQPRLRIVLLLALIKFDRFEWCLEKATELGVSEIVPLAAARSDKPLLEATAKRCGRWEKILVESSQQSRRLSPPLLRMGTTTEEARKGRGGAIAPKAAFEQCAAGCKIILSERPDAPSMRDVLAQPAESSRHADGTISVAIAIGPEGGWTDEEFTEARSAGFAEASLGANILRTETAVLSAMANLNFALG